MSGDGGGKVTKPSPRSKAREMLLKSPSVRMLESEGGSNQLAYAEFGYGESNDDDLSLSCLHAVKKLQETGRWDEAQLELETATQQSKTPREQAMGALLLAELFNKWGAASPAYSVDIMDKGAKYADDAVKFFKSEIKAKPRVDIYSPLTKDERLVRDGLFWKVLNFATVGGLGGSEEFSLEEAFGRAEEAFADLRSARKCPRPAAIKSGVMGAEEFLEGTLLFCRAKALQGEHIKPEVVGGRSFTEILGDCAKIYLEAYKKLTDAGSDYQDTTVKTVTMIGVCHLMMGMREEALVWMHREVEMRVKIYGDWNPRTRMAQAMLAKTEGTKADDKAEDGPEKLYSVDLVKHDELVWEIDPFKVSDQFRISAVLRMFETLGLIAKFSIPCEKLTNFVIKCRDSYRDANAFHNWKHAWSVTHCAYMILVSAPIEKILTSSEVLAIMISCLVHDIDHPGVNSDYLIKSGSSLALQFPYKNVLEQMHWHNAKKIFDEEHTDILEGISPTEKEDILCLVFEGIMATDMQNHKAIVSALSERCDQLSEQLAGVDSQPAGDRKSPVSPVHFSGRKVSLSSSSLVDSPSLLVYDVHKESDRLELVKAIVHASDLSGQAMEPEVAYSFGKGVLAEFHQQATREAQEKLPETPFMKNLDDTLQQAKAQLGFINFVVEPLWNNLCCIFPEIKPRHQAVLNRLGEIDFDNLEEWPGKIEGLQRVQNTLESVPE